MYPIRFTCICIAMLVCANSANAIPITWHFDATLVSPSNPTGPSGTVLGSFVYDRDTITVSSAAVYLNDSSAILFLDRVDTNGPGFAYQGFSFLPSIADLTGTITVGLGVRPLTNDGGTFPISSLDTPNFLANVSTFMCLNANCSTTTGFITSSNSGTLTSVVPIPAAAWMLASALGVLGWVRRKASTQ